MSLAGPPERTASLAIAFDADDTLWHCESLFQETQTQLAQILRRYADIKTVDAQLARTERRNIKHFGYGVKGFTLSMVETAIQLSNRAICADDIHTIIMLGKAMLEAPVELLRGARKTLDMLKDTHRLLLVTKGDLLDQSNKIDQSGLAHYFDHTEIVAEKDADTYRYICERRKIDPTRFMMIGNSVVSDVIPVLEIGGFAVHIPYHVTAAMERHDEDIHHDNFFAIDSLEGIPQIIKTLERIRS